jgi:glycosyltransferase involved in cell wall biosynthesis
MPYRILLVDPKAESVGHLLDDDLFLAQCLGGLVRQLDVRSSAASVERIKGIPNVSAKTLEPSHILARSARMSYVSKLSRLHVEGYDAVIFQSFEELSTLFFMLRHPRAKVILIVTNNLSLDRFQRRPIAAKALLGIVFKKASSVLVHCQFEVEFIAKVFPRVAREKIFVVPFHKIGVPRPRLGLSSRRKALLFVGPEQPHKPLSPVVELVANDTSRKYNYVLTNVERNLCYYRYPLLCRSDNVEILDGYLEDTKYYSLMSSVLLVLLTHDRSYEGRLSGVLCDAFSCYTPIVSMEMAPVKEFFSKYGEMGYMVDFGNSYWSRELLQRNVEEDLQKFQDNIARMKAECSMESVREAFRCILSKVCSA